MELLGRAPVADLHDHKAGQHTEECAQESEERDAPEREVADGGTSNVANKHEPGMTPLCGELCRILCASPTKFFLCFGVRLKHGLSDRICLCSIHGRDVLS